MQAVGPLNAWRRKQGIHSAFSWFDLMFVLGLYLGLCIQLPSEVSGHGYLIDPPSRSSEWRLGFKNAMNYNDNELNCGGFARQWNQNGGKCGVCGDPWDTEPPRPNEVGGTYGNGIIVRQYSVGQVIDVSITLTAQHKGWFEFRLCCGEESIENPTTQECLDANLLEVLDGITSTRYQQPSDATTGSFKVKVKLPAGLACSHGVLQWKWHAGNSWGVGSDGVGCIGCGPQEEFINCADISISSSNSSDKRTSSPSSKPSTGVTQIRSTVLSRSSSPLSSVSLPRTVGPSSAASPKSTTRFTPIASRSASTSIILSRIVSASSSATSRTTALITPRTSQNIPNTTLRKLSTVTWLPAISTKVPPVVGCLAIGLFEGNAALDKWCDTNCALNFCPASLCKCDDGGTQEDFTTCRSRGIWTSDAMDKWCISNCAGGYCPPNYCQC